MDETGWRLQGQKRTLWGAFTDKHAVLAVVASRHEDQPANCFTTATRSSPPTAVGLQTSGSDGTDAATRWIQAQAFALGRSPPAASHV